MAFINEKAKQKCVHSLTDFFFEVMILPPVLDPLGKLENVLERLQLSQRLRLVDHLLEHSGRQGHEGDDVAAGVRVKAASKRKLF